MIHHQQFKLRLFDHFGGRHLILGNRKIFKNLQRSAYGQAGAKRVSEEFYASRGVYCEPNNFARLEGLTATRDLKNFAPGEEFL